MDKRLDVRSGLDPKDFKYLVKGPDPDFSPERNQAIINETIAETANYHRTMKKVLNESNKMKLEALSYYGRYTIGEGKTKNIKEYLGKSTFEAIVGENVLSKVRIANTTNRLNGNNRFKKGIL